MKQAIKKHEAGVTKDLAGKKIIISRQFDAPVEKVWRAFTEREILDQWWAPKPWRIETKSHDFRSGGFWHFCMMGQNGECYWWRANILTIDLLHSFTSTGGPCDENANPTGSLPGMLRLTEFTAILMGTVVSITITFENEADLKMMAESGMLPGTIAIFDNLEALLESNAI